MHRESLLLLCAAETSTSTAWTAAARSAILMAAHCASPSAAECGRSVTLDELWATWHAVCTGESSVTASDGSEVWRRSAVLGGLRHGNDLLVCQVENGVVRDCAASEGRAAVVEGSTTHER